MADVKSRNRDKTIRKLLAEAHQGHSEFRTIAGKALEVAKRVGDTLNKLKRLVRARGDKWEDWCKANFKASIDTAQDYMRVARKWNALKPHFDKDPTISLRGALRILRWPGMKGSKGGWEMPELKQRGLEARGKLRRLAAKLIDDELRRNWNDEDVIYLWQQSGSESRNSDFQDALYVMLGQILEQIGRIGPRIVVAELKREATAKKEGDETAEAAARRHEQFIRDVLKTIPAKAREKLTPYERDKLKLIGVADI